jgi:hypothetical protein
MNAPITRSAAGGARHAGLTTSCNYCFIRKHEPNNEQVLDAVAVAWEFKLPGPVLIAAGAAAGIIIFALR